VFHEEVWPGSFARIAGVNSYFASRAKPGVFCPFMRCQESMTVVLSPPADCGENR